MTYSYSDMEPPRRSKLPLLIAFLVSAAVVVLACIIGAAVVNRPDDDSGQADSVAAPVDTYTAPTAAATTAASARTAKSTPPAGFSDEDTPAHVGSDIPAGTYRVDAGVAGANCYWQKSKDAEGSRIIDNGLPQGGRPQVTLAKGTWFTSERCGRWERVK
jgi:hypothetical protein